jgi:hypothetical protein
VTDLSNTANAVLESLREKPALNTPPLIAGGPHVPDEVEVTEVEQALGELVEAGHVKSGPMGWKLKPQSA